MTLKGGETRDVAAFALHMLRKYGGVGKFGPHILGAGLSLLNFMNLLRGDRVMPTSQQMSRIRKEYDSHLRSCKRAGVGMTPKHHLCTHLVDRTDRW